MRINTDFSALWNEVRKITSNYADPPSIILVPDSHEIGIQLEIGKEISLEEVDFDRGGLASVRGHQVLLYIPDQGLNIREVIEKPEIGKKFHVTYCRTLEDMYRKRRFARYVATNDLSGKFRVHGTENGKNIEDLLPLNVCKNCLMKLNYMGSSRPQVRHIVVQEFNIPRFFETYSSFFPYMPRAFSQSAQAGYPENWKEISNQVRTAANFCCKKCYVDLSAYKWLLHAHHINGVKSDCHPNNLEALCAACHRLEPLHSYVRITHKDMRLINRLRRVQGLIPVNWDDVLEQADPAVLGVLDLMRQRGMEVPQVGYEILDTAGAVIAELEVAWPNVQFGIVIDASVKSVAQGWRINTISEILDQWMH